MPNAHRIQTDAESMAAIMALPPEDRVRVLLAENDALAAALTSLEERMPTSEDIAYLRNRREQDERASWAWKTLRAHAPWIVGLTTAIGSGLYWVLTHDVSITPKP